LDLRVTDLQSMLNVSRKTLYRWIQARKIPAYRISGQYRFRREEIERWMGGSRVAVGAPDARDDGEPTAAIGELLRRGGIHYRIEGSSMSEALAAALAATTLPASVAPQDLLAAVVERERLMSTGLGHGIAVPHPREPMLPGLEDERVSLCFLDEDVDFRAPDGAPVAVLFVVLGASLKGQLRLLSLIGGLCRQEEFRQLLARRASRREILDYVDALKGVGRRA
jgi:PTS system nitrogen regulatory IIA component